MKKLRTMATEFIMKLRNGDMPVKRLGIKLYHLKKAASVLGAGPATIMVAKKEYQRIPTGKQEVAI